MSTLLVESLSRNAVIYVAGHSGLVGSAVVRALKRNGFKHILTKPHRELDLLDARQVNLWFENQAIDYVIFCAGRVGGISANKTFPVEFLYENLVMGINAIHAAARNNVKKFLYLGSSCIYPKNCPQPITEDSLLSSPLEPTNEGYALAKISCLKLCEYYFRQYQKKFISLMPTNLYGPNDTFDLEKAHVLPALLHRFHLAKLAQAPSVGIWGSGNPRREFLHADDLGEAILIALERYDEPTPLNVGFGSDLSIRELAELIQSVTQYPGKLTFDSTRPDGTPQKLLDSSRILKLGFTPKIELSEGLQATYEWALSNVFSDSHKKAA